MRRFVIIGAGPAGLGAAYRLKELGCEGFRVLERAPFVGGLASSFQDQQGFTWDIGGHVMFSHYAYYDEVFAKLMGAEYQENMRESWVRMLDRWVPYPFQNNIRHLPKQVTFECLAGLIEAQTKGQASSAKNFEEFIYAVFGEGIAKHFMIPYNFKVWAHPASTMNKEWIGERVAVVDINRALKNVVLGLDDYAWGPNNKFKYPLRGGTGEFYSRFYPLLKDHISLNVSVENIDPVRKEVVLSDGEHVPYDDLISTVPLDLLCTSLLSEVPRAIGEAARSLRHSGGHMVGIGLKQPCPSTKSWMYFPEDNCPFYRATYLSNYSRYMTPNSEQHYSLLCETSCSEHKKVDAARIVDDTIQGLVNTGLLGDSDKADIVTTWHYYADYTYPIPTVDRDQILGQVIPWLESRNIYSRGRFGVWKYEVANTDHTLMQGVELVNRLLSGEPETTIGIRYESTPDGLRAASHERSAVAGSGDPKRLAENK